MRAILPLLLLLAASACGTVRTLPVQDSTRVKVRVEREFVTDTAWVELPVIVERVVTLDTASVLENKYTKSEAFVSGGLLTHSLSTKPVREPVSVQKEIVYRDSLVYQDRVVTETVEVEKKLSSWQSFKMKSGGFAIMILLIVILYKILTNLLKLKLL